MKYALIILMFYQLAGCGCGCPYHNGWWELLGVSSDHTLTEVQQHVKLKETLLVHQTPDHEEHDECREHNRQYYYGGRTRIDHCELTFSHSYSHSCLFLWMPVEIELQVKLYTSRYHNQSPHEHAPARYIVCQV